MTLYIILSGPSKKVTMVWLLSIELTYLDPVSIGSVGRNSGELHERDRFDDMFLQLNGVQLNGYTAPRSRDRVAICKFPFQLPGAALAPTFFAGIVFSVTPLADFIRVVVLFIIVPAKCVIGLVSNMMPTPYFVCTTVFRVNHMVSRFVLPFFTIIGLSGPRSTVLRLMFRTSVYQGCALRSISQPFLAGTGMLKPTQERPEISTNLLSGV